MKHLLTLLVLLVGLNCMGQIKDSIWPVVVRDTLIALDSNGTRFWKNTGFDATKHLHKKIIDSSGWILFKVNNTNTGKVYTYFKIFSYELITDAGWDDLVGRMERQYYRTSRLLEGSKITDTIPYKMSMVSYDEDKYQWVYSTEYRVGGMIGEYIRTETDSIVKNNSPKNNKHKSK